MTRSTIEEEFVVGVMATMKTVDEVKVLTLFEDDDEINDFDWNFLGDYGDCYLSRRACYAVGKGEEEKLFGGILYQYYDSWLREKKALEAEYDLLWTGGGDVKYTETRHEEGTEQNEDVLQNSLNAFNGDVDSKTDKADRNGNGSHDITETIERSTERKENSVTYTQAEVVEKELNLRMKYKFYNIVAQDISREICMNVY